MMIKSSVVISTYNGKKYLFELMNSLMGQITKPDEVIICDDCSDDGTVEFIYEFIKKNNIKNWKVYVNEENIGWKKNFRNAIEKSSGDYIFLCDQDDIWNQEKIFEMQRIMDNSDIECLVTNYTPFFDDGVKTAESYCVKGLRKNDGRLIRIKLRPYYFSCMRPGCVYCIRRSLYEIIKKSDDVSIPHDDVIWSSAISRGTLFLYQKSLIHFRRHGDNASTGDAERSLNRRISAIEELEKIADWVLSSEGVYLDDNYEEICRYKEFLVKRKDVLMKKNVLKVLFFIICNHRYYATFRNCVSDIVYWLRDRGIE